MELKRVYKYKSLYKKKRKVFKGTHAWQKIKEISKTLTASHQNNIMIPTLLQSVDKRDPGPKPLDKETIFDVSTSKLVGKEVQNTDDLSSRFI